MDATRIDAVSRFLAQRRRAQRFTQRVPGRWALTQGGAGLAAAGLVTAGPTAATDAQDATPKPSAPDADHGPTMLFLQSFQSGSIAPKEGHDGRYTVTLEHGLGQTIYFSDRPVRIVGAMPTERFLDVLGFPADNPPNAALLVQQPSGQTDVAVVELFDPVYDPAGPGVTYEAAVLAEWERTPGLGVQEVPADLAALPPDFGAAHLFIDGPIYDC